MTSDRSILWLLFGAFVGTTVLGAVVAIRDDLDGRPLGVGVAWPVWVQTLTWGTALSAPPIGPILLCIAIATGSMRLTAVLAATFFVGVLMEPNTWTALRHPFTWPARSICVLLLIALPAAVFIVALRSIRRPAPSR